MLCFESGKNGFNSGFTLLNINVLQKAIHSNAFEEPTLSYLFIICRTIFLHKEPFVEQKGSSDVKWSLWNHLDKKVLLWHETPLFILVEGYSDCHVSSILKMQKILKIWL